MTSYNPYDQLGQVMNRYDQSRKKMNRTDQLGPVLTKWELLLRRDI